VRKATESSRDLRPSVDGRDLTALVRGNTRFALELFDRMRTEAPDENLAFGPYSVSHALAMLYAGARGETALALRNSLHFDVEPTRFHLTMNGLDLELAARNSDVLLRNANQAWVQRGSDVEADYLDVLTRDYGAPLAELDFHAPEGARGTINAWVADVTEKMIPELLPAGAIREDTVLVLTNAMYMDAPWKYAFDPALTGKGAFQIASGLRVDVDMMHFDDYLPSARGNDWAAVEIPYRGDEVSMFVVVPQDLVEFESRLTPELLSEIRGSIRSGGIHLSLPRFKFRFRAPLEEALTSLGLGILFDAPDLSGILPGGGVVDSVAHEAFIEVDEEGTRAAAATGVPIVSSHGPWIDVDRPFLFFIIDKLTGTVLFLGRVLDPRAQP